MTKRPSLRRPILGLPEGMMCLLLVAVVFGVAAFVNAFAAFVLLPIGIGFCAIGFFRRVRQPANPAGWPALLLGNLLLLAFLLSLLFLGFESYYRFLCDQTDAQAGTLVAQAWNRRHSRTNNYGVRDNIDYPSARAAGKRRVTFVGDSFTVGLGVKDVEARFVNRIRRRHPEWEIHAVAKPGLETSNEVEAVHNLCVTSQYQLDQLVLVYNMNDIGEVMPRWIAEYQQLLGDRFRNSWLCRNSYFVNFFYLRWQLRRNAYFERYFEEVTGAYNGSLWETHQIALTAFVNMTAVRGGRLVVVTFPFLHAPLQFESAHRQMDQFWKQKGVPHLDLLSVFSNLPRAQITVNAHDMHPNEHAHELAAEAIDRFLVQQIPAMGQVK